LTHDFLISYRLHSFFSQFYSVPDEKRTRFDDENDNNKKEKTTLTKLLKTVFKVVLECRQIVERIDHNAVPTSTPKTEEPEEEKEKS